MKQNKVAVRRDSRLFALLAVAASMLCNALPVRAQIEPVVGTVNTTVATGVNWGPGVTDACGNFYVNNYGTLYKYAAGTYTASVVAPSGYPYGGPTAIAIDATKTHIYAPPSGNWYGSAIAVYPVTNCTVGAPGSFPAVSGLFGYYYGTASVMTVDGYGDVFFTPTASNNSNPGPNVIAEVACGSTVGVSCNGAPPSGSNALVLTGKLPATPTSMVGDAKGNLYFVDGAPSANDKNIYEIVQPKTSSTTGSYTPVVAGTVSTSAIALNLDAQGNLYIVDSNGYNSNIYYAGTNSAIIYEVPLENGTLNFAHMFVVANGLGIATQTTIGPDGSFYYTPYPPATTTNLTQLQRDKVKFPATTVGSTASATINYYFNVQEALATESVLQGTSASTIFTKGTPTCASQTYTAGQTCSVPVSFKPGTPGRSTGGVVLADSSSNAFSLVSLSGVGNGPLVTIDPGAVNAYTSTLTAPVGAAVDNLGNLYVTDTSANTLTEFAAGTGTATTISTGSLTLSAPKGVAVDSVGDIFIVDTGNNRVVEVPVAKGALSPASSVALALNQGATTLTLSAPQGIAVTASNDLLIADTGNNRLLLVPNNGGTLATANVISYSPSLNGPSSVTVDPSGDVFVGETGNKDVLEFNAPLSVATPTKVVSSLAGPTGLATDASGSLFVVDGGNIYRYPFSAGAFGTRQNIGSAISNPLGIATDLLGNLYVTDTTDKSVTELARVQAALQFGLVNLNTTSPSQTATVNSSGNQTATIPTPAYTASGNTTAGFNVSTTCAGASLVTGATCTITASFSPTQKYGKAEEDLAIQGNTSAYSPSLALIGSSAQIYNTTLSVTQASPAPGTTINAGSPVSFTATINTGAQTFPAGGSITFYVNGASVGKVPVSNNAATISLPNGLPQGPAIIVSAVYAGDNVNYAGSQGQISVAVTPLASTASLAVTGPTPPKTTLTQNPSPYNNPISANDVTTSVNGPTFTLSATIGTGSSAIIPGGTVSFYQGTPNTGTLLGVGSVNQGVATITTTALRAGTTNVVENDSYRSDYNIYAVYNGDSYYGPSTTSSVAVTVVAAPPCAFTSSPCISEQTGATFTISPANPVVTITASNNANSNGYALLSVTSYGGWTGILNFTCSNLPKYTTCNPYPGAPLVNYSTVAATQPPTQVLFFVTTNVPPLVSTASSMPLWASLSLGLLLLVAGRGFGRDRLRRVCSVAGMSMLLLASLAGVSGCGSGTTTTTPYVTPSGTYTINVAVTAAQLNPNSSTAGATLGNDINTGSFPVTLIIK